MLQPRNEYCLHGVLMRNLIFLLYRAIPEQIEETKNGGKFEFQTFIAIFGRKLNENVENVISDTSQEGHLGI